MVFTPDCGHAYLRNVCSLTLIDTTTNDANDIDSGDLPRGMQLSPDGKRAYITNFGDGTLSVVDTITSSVVTTVDVPGYPGGGQPRRAANLCRRLLVRCRHGGIVPTLGDLHADAAS